ncbi:hypothetical protein QEZ54_25415 [Catellatospora sp. KI3]|uniref:hypothetical protein n=1 Tax=Catellatospora sp. KI3 TaxID=3041620 RepID=UPI0024830A89|nr:hypothetical protein [Catellatospora sp. KI3]MDI1464315.1 hypothetical protein [Catellatospora sp. KI3]
MTAVVLNRVGILLNFVAGFLLAPQLIGLDRIRRVEQRIERISMARLEGALNRRGTFDGSIFGWTVWILITVSMAIPIALIFLVTQFGVPWWLGALAYAAIFIPSALWMINYSVKQIRRWTAMSFQRKEIFGGRKIPFLVLLGIFALVAWPLVLIWLSLLPTRIAFKFYSGISSVLDGDDRAVSLLTFLGVIAFIAGNVLQFAATY